MPDPVTTPAPETAPAATTPPATPAAQQTPPAPAQEAKTVLTDSKTPEGKTDEASQPKGEEAPTEIQISVPKGVEVDPGLMDGFKGVVKDLGLKGEDAQKVADWYFKASGEAAKKIEASREETILKWAEEAKADKEVGGAAWESNLKSAQSALRQFGGEDFVKLLNETGLGNHKAVIGVFAKIGKSIAEDRLPKGVVAAGEQKQEVPLEERLYPTMHKPT